MSEISILPAWQEQNAKFEADAIDFWQHHEILSAGGDGSERASQLAAVAYDGDSLVGVTTAFIDLYPPLGEKLSFYRLLIHPDRRGEDIMVPMVMATFHAIQAWSKEHPEAEVSGFGSVRQSTHLSANFKSPYARTTGAVLIGYAPNGGQVRVRWFDHFRPGAQPRSATANG